MRHQRQQRGIRLSRRIAGEERRSRGVTCRHTCEAEVGHGALSGRIAVDRNLISPKDQFGILVVLGFVEGESSFNRVGAF